MRASTAAPTIVRPLRALAWRAAAAFVCLLAFACAAEAAVTGAVKATQEDGFTRLAFRFERPVGVEVTHSNGIAILHFAEPVDIAVEHLAAAAPGIIGAARRDPDGRAVRIALKRTVKLNRVPAAEWFFLDLLPENWSGLLPGAPQAVVDELARRARAAEIEVRALSGAKPNEPVAARVKVAVQPTFTRFVFPLPEGARVETERRDDALVLNFSRAIVFDLAEAQAALPPAVAALASGHDAGTTRVEFGLSGTGSVHGFRDGDTFMVDVEGGKQAEQESPAMPAIAAPQSVPAPAQPGPDAAKPAPESSAAPAPAADAAPPPALPAQPQPGKAVTADAPMPQPRPSIAAGTPRAKPAARSNAAVMVAVRQAEHALTLTFPFVAPTPAAVFQRGDALWLVFDSTAPLDLAALNGGVAGIRKVAPLRNRGGEIVLRLTLDRPRLVGATADGTEWKVTIGDTLERPPLPLSLARTIVGRDRSSVVIPFDEPGRVHRLTDPDGGERLIAITASAPARGLLKDQKFLEMHMLASAQGVALQSLADDVQASLTADSITVSRPGGLALSVVAAARQLAGTKLTFDPAVWALDRSAPFAQRESELIGAAAGAPAGRRWEPRLNVARFYIAHGLAAEAKGVLDVAMAEGHPANDVTGSILRSIADIGLQRPDAALKELSAPEIDEQQNAPLWRAVAFAGEANWPKARAGFKDLDAALAALPLELQREVLFAALRTAVETRDLAMAMRLVDVLEAVGVPPESQPQFALLIGREREELGQKQEALAQYRAAAASGDVLAAAEARLHEIALELAGGKMPDKDAIAALETLAVVWRGDDIETEDLRLLAELYRKDGRYRDAFHAMRTAVLAAPKSPITRKMQDEASATFQDLFLSGKADALPPVEALGLFYDYRDLTPIGRLGDEMIRKLADRLVAVDLLDQAAELLQHQVDKRLQGAARAQVAAKLATVYLMNHKPDRALAALRATRDSDVSNQLREQRLLLEARALSDLGRQPLALEIVAGIDTPQAHRLRADVLWSAQRWRDAAEEIERLYGERWRDFKPLDETERSDILRAAIGYSLADESISLARLREKYAAKMAEGPDARAFEVVSSAIGPNGPEFRDVARRLGSLDTLAAFLRDMRKRYETDEPKDNAEAGAKPPESEIKLPPAPKGGTPLRPDSMPTGSVGKR